MTAPKLRETPIVAEGTFGEWVWKIHIDSEPVTLRDTDGDKKYFRISWFADCGE